MASSHKHILPARGPEAAENGSSTVVTRRFVTIEELAASTTLSVSTLRRLYKRDLIMGHQPGGPGTRVVFPPDAIEQMSKPTIPPESPPKSLQRGPRPRWLGAI